VVSLPTKGGLYHNPCQQGIKEFCSKDRNIKQAAVSGNEYAR
jgi:hypothetical protein